jgi:NAD(P)-dependent dehydrogenase (short-subunit alcohol dehydrogenase family)
MGIEFGGDGAATTVRNEFASVAVSLDTQGNSPRLRLEDQRHGRMRYLDALELETLKDNPQQGNAYNFSKEVTTVYAMSMGLALHQRGFRINAVLPGPVETPILADFEATMGKDTLDGVRALLGRHADPDDIATAVLFFASDDARWVNGQALAVDGGLTGAVASGVIPAPVI